MKNLTILIITLVISGCTQVVTAPIKITGAVISSTIDIVGATAHAVTGNDKEDEQKEEEN